MNFWNKQEIDVTVSKGHINMCVNCTIKLDLTEKLNRMHEIFSVNHPTIHKLMI